MKPGDDNEFETQLRVVELRRPPEEWKSLLLAKPSAPWFPKPFLIGLTACWAATGGFIFTTPENEILSPPPNLPAHPLAEHEFLLGHYSAEDFIR